MDVYHVSLDVKGAYNGVVREVVLRRLRERRISEMLDSMDRCVLPELTRNNRRARTTRGESLTRDFPKASPPPPILSLFMNTNLVDTPITDREGAVAFMDNYRAWVVGPPAALECSV
ncbi:hypothetical protein BDV23DRAFT_178977 [Aspergillus alliaceus]|uniref:Reverse transcriptase domain-containing protein n=1 Tax=Petromyces alliaceus TaxID=209559 RepID=A0A5N7CLA2_PETAA|nr:hypothetical protein BDV23DRAFT_178977 [Aspergillus alliaceus]